MKTSNAKFFNKLALITTVAIAAGTGISAQAATATSNLNVSANVAANCSISTTQQLTFGSYDHISTNASNPLESTGKVNVACTTGSTSPSISLGEGASYDAIETTRRLTDGTNFLKYKLYQEDSFTTEWNDTNKVDAISDGTPVEYTVYGRIAANQNVPVGNYSDTVVVTVSF